MSKKIHAVVGMISFLLCTSRAYANDCSDPGDCYQTVDAALWVMFGLIVVVALVAFAPELVGFLAMRGAQTLLTRAAAAEATELLLTEEGTLITREGLTTLIEHLELPCFEPFPGNPMMIARLEAALESGEMLTGAEANFYLHELYEAQLMAEGYAPEAAHQAALEFYSHNPFSLYAREVVEALGKNWFNEGAFRYWELIP